MLFRFALVLSLASLASPAAAQDIGTLSFSLGAGRVEVADSPRWHPLLRMDLAFTTLGPMQLGGYLEVAGDELPLKHPSLGGGLLAAVRPTIDILRLRPLIELAAGRSTVPLNDQGGRQSAWTATATGGLAVLITEVVALEARVSHQWFFALPADSPLASRSWRGMLGVTFQIR